MSNQFFLICLQVTVLLAFLLLVGRIGVRWPRWASLVGLVGLTISAIVVSLGALGVSKPFEFSVKQVSDSQLNTIATYPSSAAPNNALAKPTQSAVTWPSIRNQLLQLMNNSLINGRSDASFDSEPKALHLATLGIILCVAWLLVIIVGHVASWLTLRRAREVSAQSTLRILEQCQARLGINRPVSLRQHQDVCSPCVSWIWPQHIFVPMDFESWPQQEQRAALAHELAHLKHLDVLTRMLADLALLPVAWHPLAWRVRRQVIELQELATDSNAAEAVGGVSVYRQCLSRLLLRMDARQQSLVNAFSVSFSTNKVVRRIKMLKRVSTALPKRRLAITSMGLACIAVSTVMWGVRAEDPPKLASLPKLEKTNERIHQNSQPWETVCSSNGYFVLRRGSLLQAPSFQAVLSQFFKEDATDWPSRLANKVNYIEGNLAASVTVLPESTDNGNNRTLSLGADSFNATFNAPVDSARLSSAVRWTAFGTKEQVEPLAKALAEADAKASFHSVSDRAKHTAETLDVAVQNRLQEMWKAIDIGEVTMVTTNPLQASHIADDSEASLSVLTKVESVGASYTPGQTMFQGTIKMGVFLKDKQSAAVWLEELESALSDASDDESAKFGKLLGSLKSSTQETASGELIVLEGPINFLEL